MRSFSKRVLDQRGQLLRAALGFAGLPRPSYDRALWALRTWLDSWSGIGHTSRATRCVECHPVRVALALARHSDGDGSARISEKIHERTLRGDCGIW
jgi:hypothetical protein